MLSVLLVVALSLPAEDHKGGAPAAAHEPMATVVSPLVAALTRGDEHYARRADGAHGPVADPVHIEAAIAEYRRALALDSNSFEARLRLLRAFFFRTGFCGPLEPRAEVALYDEAKKIAEETVALLDAETGRRKARVDAVAARAVEPAAEVYLWAAVSWGQWAVYHRVSAAWQGAPKRIRDLGQAVLTIDPGAAQAGAYIILGRLHCEAPRIPMLTLWVSRQKGLAFLRQGLARAPDNQALVFFLADALLTWEPSRRDEARALLLRCSTAQPRPAFLVEDAHYAQEARERLAALH
jgi:tetratricopeptide (TPR) repeat protein